MGLDVVELVMRCEEAFAIAIPNDEAERIHTVGDLYRTVCHGLRLTPLADPEIAAAPRRYFLVIPEAAPWTPENVWSAVRFIILDQLRVQESDITSEASFQRDLGAD